MTYPLKPRIAKIAADAARDAVSQVDTFRTQQIQDTSQPTVGLVTMVDGPRITVQFPDDTTQIVQVGNRWLTVGDMAVVFGGMAH